MFVLGVVAAVGNRLQESVTVAPTGALKPVLGSRTSHPQLIGCSRTVNSLGLLCVLSPPRAAFGMSLPL